MELNTVPNKESRRFTSFPGSQYLLPSDDIEQKRLHTQHDVLTRVFNGLTLSPVELQPGDKVLDSGSGAASWVLDLASKVPDTQIYGIDIEPHLFPPTPPKNVTMRVGSVLQLPKEWTNEFKLVHQRLLIAGLLKEEWPVAIGELFRVTKPTGWVELCEVDDKIICPQHATHKGFSLFPVLYESTNHAANVARLLPQWLLDAGFTDVQTKEADLPLGKWAGKDGEDGCDNIITFLRGLRTPVLKRGGMGIVNGEEEFDELIDDLERIWNESPGSVLKFFTVYGRKPQ